MLKISLIVTVLDRLLHFIVQEFNSTDIVPRLRIWLALLTGLLVGLTIAMVIVLRSLWPQVCQVPQGLESVGPSIGEGDGILGEGM
ncbi:MAG: hypothetical protein QXT77_10230 [Candidatus Methanomethylicaceae archaeon]